MGGQSQPLDTKFGIVDKDGRPTLYFIKWAQQRQIDISDGITLSDLIDYLTAHKLIEGPGIQLTNGGDINAGVTISADVQEILDQLSATRGTIIYRGLLGWTVLLPGTAGYLLQTNGPGADPTWVVAPTSGGGGGATLWGWGFDGATSPLVVAGSTTATLGAGAVTTAMIKSSVGNWYWFNSGQSGRTVTFDFGAAVVISGMLTFQDIVANQGTWQPQFSDDNVTWTSIGAAANWASTINAWNFVNSTAHRYWRLLQTVGTTSNASWQQGHMFRWGPA